MLNDGWLVLLSDEITQEVAECQLTQIRGFAPPDSCTASAKRVNRLIELVMDYF